MQMDGKIPMISVIVPVYNAEKYLRRCVESIQRQTYPNIEILLVDDGSEDESGRLCDRLAEEDPRIRVIHKKNGGQASARNAGLRQAEGELIGFADNDDVLERDMYEVLYRNKIRENVRISGTVADWVYRHKTECPGKKFESRIYSGQELMKNMLYKENLIYSSVWDKLFEKELFDSVKFPEGCEFEDYWVLSRILPGIDRIYVETVPLYHWYQYQNSRSKSGFDEKTRTYIEIPKRMYAAYIEDGADMELIRAARNFLLLGYIKYFGRVFMADALKDEREAAAVYQKELRELIRDSRDKRIKKSVLIKAWILSGPLINLYAILWKMYKKRKDGTKYS